MAAAEVKKASVFRGSSQQQNAAAQQQRASRYRSRSHLTTKVDRNKGMQYR
jgi:hypothetical protein